LIEGEILLVSASSWSGVILFGPDHSEGAKESLPATKLVLTSPMDHCRHKADYMTAAVYQRNQEQK
jgi:hypothetical protein